MPKENLLITQKDTFILSRDHLPFSLELVY